MIGLILVVFGYLAALATTYLAYRSIPVKDSFQRRLCLALLAVAFISMILGVWKSAQDFREAAVSKEEAKKRDEDERAQLQMILDEVRSLGQAARDPETAKQFEAIATRLVPLARGEDEFNITFLEPADGGMVDSFDTVRYTVSGEMPEGYVPILVVRDPLGQFWSWGSSSSHTHGVQFGVASDSGKQFEVGVLITDQNFPLNVPSRVLPGNIHYESISVRRR